MPSEYLRLGSKYGGWWIDCRILSGQPIMIDCGLGEDLSFPTAFLSRFGGRVIGVEPNPRSLAYCDKYVSDSMRILPKAFWSDSGNVLNFHLPRAQEQLPKGADGVSGSILDSHVYAGGGTITVETISFSDVLQQEQIDECDVLKMDIEGAEYEVLNSLCGSGEISRTKQLLVEFHHGVTNYKVSDTYQMISTLASKRFDLIHTEGRNYIFRRNA